MQAQAAKRQEESTPTTAAVGASSTCGVQLVLTANRLAQVTTRYAAVGTVVR